VTRAVLRLNDAVGLPLATTLVLDPNTADAEPPCTREACVAGALASHPEILEARLEVEKANAAVRLAKTDLYVPDVDAFARYSYQNSVPFLAHKGRGPQFSEQLGHCTGTRRTDSASAVTTGFQAIKRRDHPRNGPDT